MLVIVAAAYQPPEVPPAPPSAYVLLVADFQDMREQHLWMAANPWTEQAYYGGTGDPDYPARQRYQAALYDQRIAALDAINSGDCTHLDWLLASLRDGQSQHQQWVVYYAAHPDIAAQSSEAPLQSYWVQRYDQRISQTLAVSNACH